MKRVISFILIALLFTQVSGCWSSRGIEDLGIVTLFGDDKVTVDGKEEFQVSARILRPLGMKEGMSPESEGSGANKSEVLLTGTGTTLQETTREMTLRMPRIPYLGHVRGFILGEKLARQGVGQISEVFARYPDIRLNAFVAVARGEAYDILKSQPIMDETLSEEIEQDMDVKLRQLGLSHATYLSEFLQGLTSDDESMVVTAVESDVTQADTQPVRAVNPKGMAVFKKDKLVGWLNPQESIGCLLIKDKLRNSQTPIAVKENEQKFYTYFMTKGKGKVVPEVDGDKVSVNIAIETEGEISEISGIALSNETLAEIEAKIAAKIHAMVEASVDKAFELDSDFIGFGHRLHRTDPEAWHRLKDDWDTYFPQTKVSIEVAVHINQTGKLSSGLNLTGP